MQFGQRYNLMFKVLLLVLFTSCINDDVNNKNSVDIEVTYLMEKYGILDSHQAIIHLDSILLQSKDIPSDSVLMDRLRIQKIYGEQASIEGREQLSHLLEGKKQDLFKFESKNVEKLRSIETSDCFYFTERKEPLFGESYNFYINFYKGNDAVVSNHDKYDLDRWTMEKFIRDFKFNDIDREMKKEEYIIMKKYFEKLNCCLNCLGFERLKEIGLCSDCGVIGKYKIQLFWEYNQNKPKYGSRDGI